MLAQKRVAKDFRDFIRNPVPGCHARMREENSLIWDAVIMWAVDRNNTAPFHMVIAFPENYPAAAPKVGFSCLEFGYQNGATMTDSNRDSPLFGTLSICLDILGNFDTIHTEWASNKGTGWSPAYSVCSLLMNLQVVLAECADNLSRQPVKILNVTKECERIIARLDLSDIQPPFQTRSAAKAVSVAACAITPPAHAPADGWSAGPVLEGFLNATINAFQTAIASTASTSECIARCGHASDQLGALLCWNYAPKEMVDACSRAFESVGWSLRKRACVTPSLLSVAAVANMLIALRTDLCGAKKPPTSAPMDPDLACWFTLEHYSEALLGIGIQRVANGMHTNISTDGALISIDAYNTGLRQTPTKEAFEWFLPAFISPAHSIAGPRAAAWKAELASRVSEIGSQLQAGLSFEDRVIRVFSDLINTLIVRMMQPQSDLRASERIFRVLIDIWRSFVWCLEEYPDVKRKVVSAVKSFTSNASMRNKTAVPNIGCLLAMRSVVPDEAVPSDAFASAYVDESFLRGVMWWRKAGVPPTPQAVFPATEVSRHLYLFQTIFCYDVIGTTEEQIRRTASLADETECKLAGQCDAMLARWKQALKEEQLAFQRQVDAAELWSMYYKACRCARPYNNVAVYIEAKADLAGRTEGYFFNSGGRGHCGRQQGGPGRGGRGGRGR